MDYNYLLFKIHQMYSGNESKLCFFSIGQQSALIWTKYYLSTISNWNAENSKTAQMQREIRLVKLMSHDHNHE